MRAIVQIASIPCLSLIFALQLNAQTASFIHPGILHSRTELNFIKAEVLASKQPRKTWYNDFAALTVSQPDYTPKPRKIVERGFYNKPNIGGDDFLRDGVAAYSHALQYYITGNVSNARKAVEILNAWSYTLDSITGDDRKLLVGMGGFKYMAAAEIIKSVYPDWSAADQAQFRKFSLERLYPLTKDFQPNYNGNWDASMMATNLAIGIFNDDHAIFDAAVKYFLSGSGNGAIGHYIKPSGQCQESSRDQQHTQMGLGYLGEACQIAMSQGVDLYGALNNRLMVGFEYTAKYNLGGTVPWEGGGKISPRSNFFAPIYEKVYHYYHDVRGLDMPFTKQIVDKQRPEGMSILSEAKWNFLGSFLYAGLPGYTAGTVSGSRSPSEPLFLSIRSDQTARSLYDLKGRRVIQSIAPYYRFSLSDGALGSIEHEHK